MKTIAYLKNIFSKGKPLKDETFFALIDSFRHKSTPIEIIEVTGLEQQLENLKTSNEELSNKIKLLEEK